MTKSFPWFYYLALLLTVYTIDYSIDISEPGLDQVLKLLVHTLPQEEVSTLDTSHPAPRLAENNKTHTPSPGRW